MELELLFDWLGDSFKDEEAASKLEQYMLTGLLLDPNNVVPSFNRKTMEVFTNQDNGKFSFRVPKKFREKL